MIESFLILNNFLFLVAILFNKTDKLQSKSSGILSTKEEATRRQLLVSPLVTLIAFNCGLTVLPACAKDEEFQDKDEGVAGAIKSLFDPNEKTKSGKVLPKDYLKSAREVVTTLRESVKEDPNDMSKFRRTADAAKESIREYLGGWRGQKSVVNEVILFQQTKSRMLLHCSSLKSCITLCNIMDSLFPNIHSNFGKYFLLAKEEARLT